MREAASVDRDLKVRLADVPGIEKCRIGWCQEGPRPLIVRDS